jgi:heme/copper-type cytochrome/quinol oxidase subunit 3
MATETPLLEKDETFERLLVDLDRLPPVVPPEDRGEGDPFPSREPERRPLMDNAQLGMLIFLGAEAMFFAALVGAFLVLRLGAQVWPPPFQPRLPVEVTGLNTLVLLASSYTMTRALRAVRRGDGRGLMAGLGQTALLGLIFLAVQGYEWTRLVHFGLTVSSGAYGTTFYTLIGAHGVHVLAAVVWLSVVLAGAMRARPAAPEGWGPGGQHGFRPSGEGAARQRDVRVTLCGMYWYFVVFLWPLLYALVYLR